jgi:hypothetical protein
MVEWHHPEKKRARRRKGSDRFSSGSLFFFSEETFWALPQRGNELLLTY